jgi:hypothetical protein
LAGYQAQMLGGRLLASERAAGRTRFTASTRAEPETTAQYAEHLKAGLKAVAPFQEIYVS